MIEIDYLRELGRQASSASEALELERRPTEAALSSLECTLALCCAAICERMDAIATELRIIGIAGVNR